MSNFQNATWNDVAAEVVGTLKRNEVVNSADLDNWFRDASVSDGCELLKALMAPVKVANPTPFKAADQQTAADKAYRRNLKQLNVRLAQQDGFMGFMQRLHDSRQTNEEENKEASDTAVPLTDRQKQAYEIASRVPHRTARGIVEKTGRSILRGTWNYWYEVVGVRVASDNDNDNDSEGARYYPVGFQRWTRVKRQELMGSDPDQWIGHLAEITYASHEDVNTALKVAGFDDVDYGNTDRIKTFKIVD
jgi:hypothetical protein